jgi:hypothetical protein
MKKKPAQGGKERKVLKPINGDARAFLTPWKNRGKVRVERGRFICKSCGADFVNELSLAYHCKDSHAEIYFSELGERGNTTHIRCRMCGVEMRDTQIARTEHLAFHGNKQSTDFCFENKLPNLFEKF